MDWNSFDYNGRGYFFDFSGRMNFTFEAFFSFKEENIDVIHDTLYKLSSDGLDINFLSKLPIETFKRYIKLYNKKNEEMQQ